MMTRMARTWTVAAALIAIAAISVAASVPITQQLLPPKDSVKGFGVMANSLQYGKGDDISKIYNGGYELYTKAGVVDAARQMYQHGSDYIEVTTHSMKSDKAAVEFLKYWQKENKVAKLIETKTSKGFVVTKPSVGAYFVRGKYFVTVSAFYPAERAVKDVKAFQSVIDKRIAAAAKPSGKRR